MDNLELIIKKAFSDGVNWKTSKGSVQLKNIEPPTFTYDVDKYFQSLNLKKCDSCGKYFLGKKYPFIAEPGKVEKTLITCENCYIKQLN